MRHQVFDLHCDTSYELCEKKQNLGKNLLQIDLERMEEYDTYIQVFAAYVDKKTIPISPMKHCLRLIHRMRKEIADSEGRINLITNKTELNHVASGCGHGAILSIEGGEALEGDLSAIKMYYDLGVRLITLTWNWANELADGVMEPNGGGLTPFGRKAVSVMETMGILIDVSHLSEQGFWDVAEITKKPFVASHSCVKRLCSHPRNLTDAQIRCLIQRRGGIGINFFPEFLSNSGRCKMEEIVKHMEYIFNLNGENSVGIGSDFDGLAYLPEDINGIEDVKKIISCMESHGWSETMIYKVLFGNFHRIFLEIMTESA